MHNAASGTILGSSSQYPTYTKCNHDGYYPEISLRCGVELSGAQGHAIDDWSEDTKLIIDCAGLVKLPKFPTVNNFVDQVSAWPELEPQPLLPHCPEPRILRLHWPDQGAPPIELSWWPRLLNLIKRDYMGHVIVTCVGGHGRTGTALTALMLTDDPKLSVEEAVKMVRLYHCPKAVESIAQLKYLGQFRPQELAKSEWLRYEAGLTNVKPMA